MDLLAGLDDLPVQVLGHVGDGVLLAHAGQGTRSALVLEVTGQWNGASNLEVWVGHVTACKDTDSTDHVLVVDPVGAVVGLWLTVKHVDVVGAVETVARSLDVADVLVLAAVWSLERRKDGRVLAKARERTSRARLVGRSGGRGGWVWNSFAAGVGGTRVAHGALGGGAGGRRGSGVVVGVAVLDLLGDVAGSGVGVASVQLVDKGNDGVSAAIASQELWVGVLEDGPVLDVVGGPEVGGILAVWLEGRVGALGRAAGNSPSRVRSDLRSTVAVGVDGLPDGEEAVDVGVVEPEDGVEGRERQVGHVATRDTVAAGTTRGRVDSVVDALQAVRAGSVRRTSVVVGEVEVVVAS